MSSEFNVDMSNAPSATCLKCNESVPISVLRSHVEGCTGGLSDNGSIAEPPDLGIKRNAEQPQEESIASPGDNSKPEKV